ncbi:MAG: RDD family protein [Methylotetracoccus sp.]|jgi:uncharacterized RDD family membrane protein YckC|nr:RDD family protein [Methylotetracoccus sp.]
MTALKRPATTMRSAGLFRRLAALVYDSLLLFAILFVATACVLPLTGGQALPPRQWLYSAYLAGITVVFVGWCWTHGGQTLGMRAWDLRVCAQDGGNLNWRRSALRMIAACLSLGALGLGYLWVLIDPRGLAWHDRLSGTRVIRIERSGRSEEPSRDASGASDQAE